MEMERKREPSAFFKKMMRSIWQVFWTENFRKIKMKLQLTVCMRTMQELKLAIRLVPVVRNMKFQV